MFKTTKVFTSLAAAFGGSLLIVSLPALAQQSTPQALERVEITGSAIKRVQAEGALPVQVITKREIERSGVTSVVELMQNLSSVQGGFTEGDAVGGGGGGLAEVSIHNLGGDRTLVLLNGRRMIGEAGGSVDLNMIPLAIIERVEVLTDGASALYGSDAVAGVVNFITKRNASDGNISIMASKPSESGGAESNVSISKGFGNLDTDGFNVLVGLSADKRKALNASQRDFAKTGVIKFGYDGKRYMWFNGSGSTIPGNVLIDNDPDPNNWYLANPYLAENGECPERHVELPNDPACYFDYASTVQAHPDRERTNLFASFATKLGSQHTLSADVLMGRTKTNGKIAAVPGEALVNPTGPLASYLALVGRTGAGNLDPDTGLPAAASVYYRAYDLGNRTSTFERSTNGLWLSLEGTLSNWDYTATLGHQRATVDESNSGYPLSKAFGALLQSGVYNPFVLPGNQSDAAKAAAAAIMISGLYSSEKSTLTTANFQASRELFALGGGQAALAVGGNYAKDKVSTHPSQVALGKGGVNGDDSRFGDSVAEIPYSADRQAMGLFAEVVAPLSKQFELTVGLRYDDYKDVDSAVNGKVSFRYQPSSSFLLRGSVGSGFRAPTLRQLYRPLQEFGVTARNYACTAEMGQMAASLGAICQPGVRQYNVYTGGNPKVKPEESKQATLGFRFEPMQELSIGADLWWVRIEKTFGSVDEDEAFGNVNKYADRWMTYKDPNTGNVYLAYNASTTNLGNSFTSGIDFDVTGRYQTPVGRLTSSLRATYMLRDKKQLLEGGEYFSTIADNNPSIGEVAFRWKGQLANTLEMGRWSHTANINFQSGYKDYPGEVYGIDANGDFNGDDREVRLKVKSYVTLDWQTSFKVNKALNLSAGVKNLFDKAPPMSLRNNGGHMLGFDYRYYSALGRTLQLKASYDF